MKKPNRQFIKVLLIDDNKSVFVVIRKLLTLFKDADYQLEWAKSYAEALEIMPENRHDVYLLDYRLGKENGIELLREVKQKGCSGAVILLTEYNDKRIDLEAMQAGAVDYLIKSEVNVPMLERSMRYALEHARTLQALRHSEHRFRNLIETLPVMFYAVEPRPPYAPIYISPEFASLGYPLEQWLETADLWTKILHPDDREWVLQKTKAALRAGKDTDYEYRVIAQDKTVRWMHDRGRLIRDESGKLVYWQGVIFDITDQKEAQEALRENEERFSNLFDNVDDVVYVHDLQGNYVSINRAVERIFGYRREEVLKMNMTEFVTPESLEVARLRLNEKLNSKIKQSSYEIVGLTKDGRQIPVEINSCAIYKDGAPIAVQGIARDITERKRVEEALRESEAQFRDLFENANDLIYTHDLQGNFTSLNRAGEIITGFTRAEALEKNISEVVAPDFLKAAREMTFRKLNGEPPTAYELEILTKDQRRVILELSTRLILQNGKPVGVQGIGRDITERKRAENSLHKTVSLLASTLESSNDGIVVINSEGEIVVYNQRFLEMWRIPPEIIEQKKGPAIIDFVKDQLKDPEKFLEETAELYSDPLATSLHTLEFTDGRVFERYSQPQYLEENPVGRVCSFRDITERKLAEEKILFNAMFDTLTSLPNRAQFMDHLKEAIARTRREESFQFAVLFLDLDRFKVINDGLGHLVGDKLLVALAERLKLSLRDCDIVARLGGDEFTILLGGIENTAEAVAITERLQKEISAPFRIESYQVFTTASIGISVSDEIRRNPEDFLRDADAAMYRAKEAGKARWEIFDREMHVSNMNILRLETDLRRALERGEFEVYYQPIISLSTGNISEFEALIRWRHPERGLVMPKDFISVAEETGLIVPVGKWILEEACRQVHQWQARFDLFERLSVSVNLSAKQLMHPLLKPHVEEILTNTGLSASSLNLEVTESTVMENSDTALDILSELHRMGIRLSTDDFGTGYSSLSYLHHFPFERLKIDRSFINKMDTEAKSRAIVRTILMLGLSLNIEVIAEGIENENQLTELQALGCRFGQGFLFAKPLPAAEAERLLEKDSGISEDFGFPAFKYNSLLEVEELQ